LISAIDAVTNQTKGRIASGHLPSGDTDKLQITAAAIKANPLHHRHQHAAYGPSLAILMSG
jgi:hypothetical protein